MQRILFRKGARILLLLSFLCIGILANAQLTVTLTGTNGTCQSDASVKAGTKGAVAPITFELRNSSNVVIRPGQPDSNFTGLPPATYRVAVYDANHPSVPVVSSNIGVSTSYSALSISSATASTQSSLPFTCTSNSLAGYSTLSWSYSGKGPYTLSVLSGPTMPTPVQIPGGGSSGRINGLASGNYIFSLTDACNSTVSTNTLAVAGTASTYPASFSVNVNAIYPSSVTTCGKGLDIYMNVTASGGTFSSPARMYAEFPANSGNFTDTVTNNTLNVIFSSPLTPAQINNASFNVWVQQPCTGAWQKSTFTVPDNSMAVGSSVPFIVPNSCDSIIPYITVSFPRNNVLATTAVYCYPIRFTVAKATDPGTFLKDSSINSGGFSNYNVFYQPVTSGTYKVTLTDANGYQEQQTVIITATSPKKLSYAASADPSDCSLSSQYLLVAGNSFLQDGPYPVTLKLISATGLPDLSIYPPIVISSYPNTGNWINLWKIPLIPNNAAVLIEATWTCPRKDTGVVSSAYLQKKYPYSSIKLDSAWYTIGSAGCSGNKANIGLRIAVKDTLGNTIPNNTGSFVIKVLSPGGIYQQYFSSGIQQNVFTNVSPGTYTIVVAPNMPQFTGIPSSCAYWDTIQLIIPPFGLPSINTTQTYGIVCPGQTTGSLTIVANGYPPFKYAIRQQGAPTFGSQQSSNVFTGLTPGYYDVQLQDGCNNIVVQTVQVINLSSNALLTVSGASASGGVCAGGRAVLKILPIGPTTSITWTLPGGGTVTNIDSLVVTNFDATKAGAYSVSVVSGAGCTINDSRTLSLGAQPSLIITNPSAICLGDSINLTSAFITQGSTNVASLSYYANAAATIVVANPNKVYPTGDTTLYIKATSADGCSVVQPVLVKVLPRAAAADISAADALVCSNAPAFLSATSKTITNPVFRWYTSSSLGTPVFTGTSAYQTPPITANTTYYVTVSGQGVCQNIAATAKAVQLTLNNACGASTPTGCSATGSLLYLDDFGGNKTSDPNYSSTPLTGRTTYAFAAGASRFPPQTNQYSLTKNPNGNGFAQWYTSLTDHTGSGYMAIFNADLAPGTFYTDTLTNLCPGVKLYFSAWAISMFRNTTGGINPNLTFILTNPVTGDVVSTLFAGDIPNGDKTWRQYGLNFTVPEGLSSVVLSIKNNAPGGTGNDVALDDIAIYSCTPPVTITGLKPGGNYCAGETLSLTANYTDDGTLGTNYVYQWYYSATGDLTSWNGWAPVSGATTAVLNTAPSTGYYRVVVGSAANIAAGRFNCCAISNIVQVTVNPSPAVNPITGNGTLCVATSTVLSNTTPGGVWTSSNTGIATVDASGKVTAITAGTANIIYTVTGVGGCSTSVSMPVVVNPVPTVNNVATVIYCADAYGTNKSVPVNFSGSVAGTSFNWTMTSNIGYAQSGTGDIPSFGLILPAGSPSLTSTVTVTPVANGCTGVKSSFSYILNPYPQLSVSVNNASQCLGDNKFVFTNTSNIPGNTLVNYTWHFDNGVVINSKDATTSFTTAGTHNYVLDGSSDQGCTISLPGSVTVQPQPTASFIYQVVSPNTNDQYSFTSTSTSPSGITGMSYYWDFGDGTYSSAANPTHTYTAEGSYTVKLTVTTADGCSATATEVITVKKTANLIAGFTINNAAQCLTGNSFVFTNTSTVSGGATITGYSWNFGDGGTSTAASPTHNYAAPGTYTVTLSATSNTGFTDVVTQSVNVYAIPDVNLPASTSVCHNTNTAAILFSSTVGNPSYTWTNNNTTIGLAASGNGNIASFTAINTGTTDAVATIIVTPSQNGCTGLPKTFTITVNPIPDVSGYTNQTVCAGGTVNAENFTSTVSGTIFSWTNNNISIGLAASGSGNIPAFTAINTGLTTQTANIQVTGNTRCASPKYNFTIIVNPLPSLTSATIAAGICSGTSFGYSPASSTGGTTFTWSRAAVTGIAETASNGTGNINEVLTNTTTSPVTVAYAYVLTSQSGCTHKDTVRVTVFPVPVVGALPSLNVCNGSAANVPAFSSNITGVDYIWQNSNTGIGLADAGTGNIPSFTALNGTNDIITANISVVAVANYQQFTLLRGVPLTVSAPPVLGCVSAPQNFVIAVNPSITVNKLNDTTVCPGAPVTMPAFSGNGPAGTVYNWTVDQNIGLPLSGSGNLPVFTAVNAGNTPVTATITVVPSVNTCASTPVTSRITVNPVVTPSFTINTTPQCLSGNAFTFTNTTAPASGVAYQWNFGDDSTSVLQNPTHTYATAGNYTVTLNAMVAGSSCASVSFTKDVVVNVMPNAAFIYAVTAPNTNNSFLFTSKSSISEGSIVSYSWDFGDGTTSALQNPTHTYAAAGNYSVNLIITSNNGCTASITQNVVVTIDPNLVAGFTINDNAQCIAGNTFLFVNTSTISNGAVITGYLWDFGDGATSADANPPAHTYATAGNYIVTLSVTSNTGYTDIVTKSVMVYPTPEMQDINDIAVCTGSNTPVIRFKPIVPGLTFSWTNDNTSIGLAASGDDGRIPSFIATNTSNTPAIANVTVMPSANGCAGIPQTFTITVNPTPTVSGYTSQVVCAGTAIAPVNFTSNVAGTTFNWDNDNSTTGIAASGAGNIASITALNSGVAPVVSTITVTPQANSCTGLAGTFTITVNPLPVMTSSVAATTLCSGNTFHYTPQSSSAGVTFNWSRAAVAGIINPAASGAGDPNELLVNTTAAPVIVNYIYSLTANGCNSAATYTIPVTVNPVASLSSPLTAPAICNNTRFSYVPASTTPGATFAWTRAADAYNAAANGIGNPIEILQNGGTTPLTVTYVYTTSANGCTGSIQNVQVVVNPDPNDDFSANGPQCLNGNNFVFTLNPNSGATSYNWNFGDGATATGTNPSHSYTIDGLYPVTLTVNSGAGCSRTVQHTVLVQPSPVAQFVYNTIAPNSNDEYQFTDVSIIGSGALASYNWDFGDGNTSTVQNPTHTYTASGTYTVTLTVTSVLGCSATVTETLIVNKDPNVIAGFTINDASQCISGNAFVFTDATTTAPGITVTGYTWDFGDGTPVSNLQSPTHNYVAAGIYVVKLHVTGTDGINTFTDDVTQTVTVFATPDMQQPQDQVVCNQASTAPVIFKPIQAGLSFNWTMNTDIGDGTSGLGNIVSFIASNTGNTPVTATVTVTPVANGCTGTAKTFSIIVNPTPTVGSYANQSLCAGSNITAVNFSSNVSGATYAWINNNTSTGIAASGNGDIPSVAGVNNGIAPEVSSITVLPSANGCNGATATFTITVNPVPVMTSSTDGGAICSGATFHYTPQSATAGATFSWSRAAVAGITEAAATGAGDPNETLTNTTALPITVTYVYTVNANTCNSPSTYNVQVVVNPSAVLSSVLTAPAICSGTTFSYLPTSATPGAAFNWSRAVVAGISNAAATGSGNPHEVLVNTTNLPVTVTYGYTLTANGCTSGVQNVSVVVNPLPTADFTINLPIQCLSTNNFIFTNTSSIGSGTLAYTWNLDDGTIATSQDVTHTYQTEGIYTVQLVAAAATGCSTTVSKTVQVNPSPVAGFTYDVTSSNSDDSFQFTNTSIISSGNLTSYLWDFGDNSSSTQASPAHVYTNDGTYTVTLIVTSILGCSDVTSQDLIVTIDPNIKPSFTINNATQCFTGNGFVFTNTTTAQNIALLSYNWDFGDGSAAVTTRDASHTYAAPGAYIVTLTVTGSRGYVAVLTQAVIVFPTPTVVKPADQVLCNNTATRNINFTGGITSTTYNWTNDHPEIGLSASGAGNITSFIAQNTTNAPIVATIAVTPVSNGCTGTTQTFNITVNPTPTTDPVADQQLCAGQATTAIHFTGGVAGTTFRWLNNNTSVGLAAAGTGDIPSFTAVNNSNITSTATIMVAPFTATCSGTAQSITIGVKPVPQLTSTITPNAICDSAIFNYEPSSNVTGAVFNWSRASVPGISNAAATGTGNPNELLDNTTVLPVNVTYVYTVSASSCNSTSYNVTVTVNPRPKLTSGILAPSICDSTLFSYTPASGTPGTTFDWIRNAVPGINNPAGYGKDNPNEVLDNSTTVPVNVIYAYTLNANNCYNTYNINVTVNPKPVLTSALAPTAVCSGTVFNYVPASTTTGVTYSWSRAAIAGISNPAATGTGLVNETLVNTTATAINVTYVYALAYNSCVTTYNVTVKINPSPSLTTIPTGQELCAGQTFNTVPLAGPVTGTVYSWTNSNTEIGLAASGTGTIPAFVGVNPYIESIGGTITVTAITPDGCSMPVPVTFVLKVNSTPPGTITTPLGTTLCTGSAIPIVATGGNTYQWYKDGVLIPGATAAQLAATSAGTYSVSATTNLGCSVQQAGNIKVAEIQKPKADFDFSGYCINVPVTFTDKSTVANSGIVNYLWADNAGHTITAPSPVITYTVAGNVVMKLKLTPQLCPLLSDSLSKTLAIEAPQAGQGLPLVNTTANASTQLNARNIGNTSYLWLPSTGLNSATIQNPVATLNASQQYRIQMGMPSGCIVIDSLQVSIRGNEEVFIPNMITPNGDGKNDQLIVVGLEKYPNSTMLIFNRWGNQVYRSNNYDNKWDGSGLLEGTYFYVLKLRLPNGTEKEMKGWILLNRGNGK